MRSSDHSGVARAPASGMSLKLYDGDFADLTGGIFASWFVLSSRGPTAFAVGFAETADQPWALFYRWMSCTGGKTYLGAPVAQEIAAAPECEFGDVFLNFMLALNNHI